MNNIQNTSTATCLTPRTYLFRQKAAAGQQLGFGHRQAEENAELLADMLDREADNSDSLEGFVLTHSIAGGTGSGMGSYILEHLNDHFQEARVDLFGLPELGGGPPDVVVQPYKLDLNS